MSIWRPKTAYLAEVLAAGGGEVSVSGSNPQSTKDDVAAALATGDPQRPTAAPLRVYARHGVSVAELHADMRRALEFGPHIIIDDGGDLLHLLHSDLPDLIPNVRAVCEETTTGVQRARGRAAAGTLRLPVIAVNDAECKQLFDSYCGTGQSTWDGIMRTTNLCVSGRTVVVFGYGPVGRGCVLRAKGLGARPIVCEVNPIRAIEARMEGIEIMTAEQAIPLGDLFITATGCIRVLQRAHFARMKSGR